MTTADSGAPETGTEATESVDPPDTDTVDWKTEAEKQKALSRKWEERSKANAEAVKELDALKQQSMSDQERAVAEARAQARAEALAEVATDRAADAFRVAAAGRNVDIDELIEGINVSRFIDDNGQPRRDEIAAWLNKVAPATDPDDRPKALDLGQGARGGQPPALNSTQLERDLKAALGVR